MTRVRCHYSGRVQGVGFRATALSIAAGSSVQGSVKNLPDGRVELIAQGEASEVERFLDAVEGAMRLNIRRIDRENEEPVEPSGGFRVTY